MKSTFKLKWIALLVCGVLCASFLGSCGDDDDSEYNDNGSSSLIGTWEADYGYCKITDTFRSDGTGKWTRKQSDGNWYSDFTYTILSTYSLGGVSYYRIKETITATNAQGWGDKIGKENVYLFAISGNTAFIDNDNTVYRRK